MQAQPHLAAPGTRMTTSPLPIRRLRAADLVPRRRSRLDRLRLADGATTTLHVAAYRRDAYMQRVVVFDRPLPRWSTAATPQPTA